MVKSDFSKDEIAEKRKALFELLGRKQKREVTFPLFARGVGFYSEMNNLAMLLLYCLHQGIKFRLDSSYMISDLGIKGWEALFHPFCEECQGDRTHRARATKDAYSLFDEFRSPPRIMRYDIPELGIKGDMLHALRIISAILFDLNKETESRIRAMLGTAYNYAYDLAAHIRRGDKNTEDTTHYSAQDYVIASRSALRKEGAKIFVASDDYRAFEEYKSLYPDACVTSSCRPEQKGYYHSFSWLVRSRQVVRKLHGKKARTPVFKLLSALHYAYLLMQTALSGNTLFNLLSVQEKNKAVYQLLADTHVMVHARACLGSFSSNVYRAVCVFRGGENCYFINRDVPDYHSPGFYI